MVVRGGSASPVLDIHPHAAGVSVNSPSGEQFEIELGEQRAVVTEVGGALRTYTVGDRSVLDGYGVDEMANSGRGQVLIPWPNRLQDGSYEFDGREHQLPLNEIARSNAIHGLVRWVAWSPREREAHRVVVGYVLHAQPGYPFTLDLEIEYSLSEDGLRVGTEATNIGATACPFGSGAHPYLTVGTETVDDVLLRIPAHTVLRASDRGIPVGSAPVEGTDLDFRAARAVGAAKLDHGFTDLARGEDGLARVQLSDGGGRHGVTLWVDDGYPYLMVFTGDLPDVARRGLAVEPMTCSPNAFRSGEALVTLEPGDSHTAAWGVSPTR
jgi:aldose 1-epimerase